MSAVKKSLVSGLAVAAAAMAVVFGSQIRNRVDEGGPLYVQYAPPASTSGLVVSTDDIAEGDYFRDMVRLLKREFVEELGVEIRSADPWCCVEHVYPHAHVRLHFYLSRDWKGEPQSLEGQALAWQGAVQLEPLLPATIPLIQWLEGVRYAGMP